MTCRIRANMASTCSYTFQIALTLLLIGSVSARSLSEVSTPAVRNSLSDKRETVCSMCRNVSLELSKVILDPRTETVATFFVEELICSNLPGALLKQCKSLIKQYVPKIISIIGSDITPENLCTKTKICAKENSYLTEVQASFKCDLCIELATELLILLRSGKTQNEILAVLHKTCQRLKPASVAAECTEYVDMYFPQLAAIIETVTPKEACRILKQCDANQTVSSIKSVMMAASALQIHAMAAMGTNSEECVACKFLVSQARKKLKNPVYQNELQDYLLTLCDKIPDHSAECKDALDKYLPDIFANIDTYVDPTKVCQDLNFCTPHLWMHGYVETVGGALYA